MAVDGIIDDFKIIQKEIKFLTNSDNRIKIMESLYNSSKSLKNLQIGTDLTNSSISINISQLEDKGYVINQNDIFFLTNKAKIILSSIFNLNNSINLLKEDFEFINSHKLEKYHFNAFKSLPMISNCELVKSSSVDIFKISKIFKEFATGSKQIKSIFPFMHPQLVDIFNDWFENDVEVKLILDEEVLEVFDSLVKEFMNEDSNCKIFAKSIDKPVEFALIISDKGVVIGSYKKDGKFDQNAVYTTTDEDAILWANNIFEEYESLGHDYILCGGNLI